MVKIGIEADSKKHLLTQMVQIFVDQKLVRDGAATLAAILEREERMSTGLAGGLALPHAKCQELDETHVAVGITANGVDFDSLDREPVYVVVMVLSAPGKQSSHIALLSEVATVFTSNMFADRLRKVDSADAVLSFIRQAYLRPAC